MCCAVMKASHSSSLSLKDSMSYFAIGAVRILHNALEVGGPSLGMTVCLFSVTRGEGVLKNHQRTCHVIYRQLLAHALA